MNVIKGSELNDRIMTLERECAALRKAVEFRTYLAVGLAILSGVIWISMETSQQTSIASLMVPKSPLIETQGIVIRDETGKVRAVLGHEQEGQQRNKDDYGLFLFGAEKQKVSLITNNAFPSLTFNDKAGKPRLLVKGYESLAGLSIKDDQGQTRLELEVEKDGGSSFLIRRNKDRPGLQLGLMGAPTSERLFMEAWDVDGKTYSYFNEKGQPITPRE